LQISNFDPNRTKICNMATIKFFTYAKESKSAPIYVKVSAGREAPRLILKTGLSVDPDRWSNTTETIKQRTRNESDKILIKKIDQLRSHIKTEHDEMYDVPTLVWLQSVIDSCFKKRSAETKNLNDFISAYIKETKNGEKQNPRGLNITLGTARGWEGFQRIFNEYQGVYTEKRLKALAKDDKMPRPLRLLNYEDITVSFYNSFMTFLVNEGYQPNTVGRFIKNLKYFMQKSLYDKKHTNRDFQNKDIFKIPKEDSFSVYLTQDEVEKIYRYNLKTYPRMELARDAFCVLCETALRISDYKQVDLNIREVQGKKLIYITTKKTSTEIVIPASKRIIEILKKYDNKLPIIPDQYINEYIKIVAKWCGIDQELHYQGSKFGKKYPKSAKKYELISCHTGRRTAISNMVKAKIPLPYIMSVSGHKTEKQLMEYVKLTSEEIALELSAHEYYTGVKLKIVG
jgi:integrase